MHVPSTHSFPHTSFVLFLEYDPSGHSTQGLFGAVVVVLVVVVLVVVLVVVVVVGSGVVVVVVVVALFTGVQHG